MKEFIEKCLAGEHLTPREARRALELIMSGTATDAQIAGFLVALRSKGETVEEIVAFAEVMREKAIPVVVDDPDAVDIVGTGGDGLGTFNISTIASFVAAGAGATVAKHGNRSVSSKCGSADLLSAMGVNIELSPKRVQECINEHGIGFMFARTFHPAMRSAAKPRMELGVRTIFNLLGPLTNPGGVKRHLIGAYNTDVAAKLASALERLGSVRACVVHSRDGMDEVALSSETDVVEISSKDRAKAYALSPKTFNMKAQPVDTIVGGTVESNVAIAQAILKNVLGPARDVVIANAAVAIYVAGKARSIEDGVGLAADSLASGKALEKLNAIIEYSNRA